MDCIVHVVAESQTRLSDFHSHLGPRTILMISNVECRLYSQQDYIPYESLKSHSWSTQELLTEHFLSARNYSKN